MSGLGMRSLKQKNNNQHNLHNQPVSWVQTVLLMLLTVTLPACQDSVPTETLPQTESESTSYTGPAARTTDIQNFRVGLWEPLRAQDRCGACHNTDGQAPTFVREDDVNEAYAAANALVVRDDIVSSLLVTKVAGGHNCWVE